MRTRSGVTPGGKRYFAQHGKEYSLVNIRQSEHVSHVRKKQSGKVSKIVVEIKQNRPTLRPL